VQKKKDINTDKRFFFITGARLFSSSAKLCFWNTP